MESYEYLTWDRGTSGDANNPGTPAHWERRSISYLKVMFAQPFANFVMMQPMTAQGAPMQQQMQMQYGQPGPQGAPMQQQQQQMPMQYGQPAPQGSPMQQQMPMQQGQPAPQGAFTNQQMPMQHGQPA